MKHWYRAAPAKFILWLLSLVFAFTAAAGSYTLVYMYQNGVFIQEYRQLEQAAWRRAARPDAYSLANSALYEKNIWEQGQRLLSENEMVYAQLLDLGRGNEVIWSEGRRELMSSEGCPTFSYTLDWDSIYTLDAAGQPTDQLEHAGPYQVTVVYQSADLPLFAEATFTLSFLYRWRFELCWLTGGAALLALICYALVIWGAGRRKGSEEAYPGLFTAVPFDLFTAAAAALAVFAAKLFWDAGLGRTAGMALAGVSVLTVLSVWCIDIAIRHKMGGVWRTALIARVCRVAGDALAGLPLVPYTALALVTVALVEALAMAFFLPDISFSFVVFWLAEKLVLSALVLCLAAGFRRLQFAAAEMAAGHLDCPVDTARLPGPLKEHGENLSAIAASTDAAVRQRLKSELFKTNLITNVSHDIKTPLTSIINYTDLICQEKSENPSITQYAEVLHRQAERLKKLLEDLMQASKVATGNLESHPAPCQVGVLLEQAGGEYEQKLEENQLELVLQKPEEPVTILADGQHLWRVFDNLMNNICKYAQPHTRVYLSLETKDGQAVVTFRNISRNALNVAPDQLLERFSRGDSSRTTEGSGLGLSIAQSLTEMQGGRMELVVDGDLFKIILTFPTVPTPAAEPSAPETALEPLG